jgi:hypothetical protein
MILIPKVVPFVDRGTQFRLVDRNATLQPSSAGPLVHASWQLSTAEKTPVCEPVPVDIPNEITLAQLVSSFIVPAGFEQVDANTVFFWTLEVISDPKSKDKTRNMVVQIPPRIPVGFNLRVMASFMRIWMVKGKSHAVSE